MEKCPNCGTVPDGVAKFCDQCGTNLQTGERPPKAYIRIWHCRVCDEFGVQDDPCACERASRTAEKLEVRTAI